MKKVLGDKDAMKEKAFIEACDACKPGVATKAIQLFNQWWKSVEHGIQTRTYIASLSEHDPNEREHGRLSMWRAFGANATARVAMVFRTPIFGQEMAALKCMFSPVAYLREDEVHSVVDIIIANVQQDVEFLKTLDDDVVFSCIFNMFVAGVTCLKHEGFKEEREWRVIYSPGQYSSPLIEEDIKILGSIPQVIYKLPLDKSVSQELAGIDFAEMFDSLIIGPATQPWVMYEAFTRALTKAGVPNAEALVFTSGIPLRSL